jgi:hypothetical protein
MRLTILPAVALTALIASAAMPVATASASAPASFAATHTVTVLPVTSTGHAASGFHVTNESGEIDCSFADPSPGALAANIEECSPSVAYAIACWKAAKAHDALCLRNPSSHHLFRIHLMGSFASTPAPTAALRAPLLIVLTDGTKCTIRDGGAWGTLASHPKWNGSYSCTKHGDVWAPPSSKRYGVNEAASSWTVHTASATGTGGLTVRHIKRAYFVGTSG